MEFLLEWASVSPEKRNFEVRRVAGFRDVYEVSIWETDFSGNAAGERGTGRDGRLPFAAVVALIDHAQKNAPADPLK